MVVSGRRDRATTTSEKKNDVGAAPHVRLRAAPREASRRDRVKSISAIRETPGHRLPAAAGARPDSEAELRKTVNIELVALLKRKNLEASKKSTAPRGPKSISTSGFRHLNSNRENVDENEISGGFAREIERRFATSSPGSVPGSIKARRDDTVSGRCLRKILVRAALKRRRRWFRFAIRR